MASTCGLNRLLSAGAMGFIGASPLHNAFANWFGAAVGVGVVYAWTRWHGPTGACDIVSAPQRDERRQRVDARTGDES